MRTWTLLLVGLAASAASGEETRIAVHPLEAPGLTEDQRARLRAFFDVRVARTRAVRFARSSAIEQALLAQPVCATKDACLRQLARDTDSMYAVFAQLDRPPNGGELTVTARVVRRDGALVKRLTRGVQPVREAELVGASRTLVSEVVDALELHALPPTMPPVELFSDLPPPPLVKADPAIVAPPVSQWRAAGVAIVGAGTLALIGGAVLYGLAAEARPTLDFDENGDVPPAQEARAREVAAQARAGTIMIPLGAVVIAAGALIGLMPDDRR